MVKDVGYLGILEQCLGGDAANVEADTSPILLFYNSNLFPELRGADGGNVATGARTEDNNVIMFSHET